MLSSLMIAAAIMFSCEKEDITVKDDNSNQNSTITSVEKASAELRIWYDNGDPDGIEGEDYGCHESGGNCYPEVVVTPSIGEDLDDVIDVINTEDSEAIISSFHNNESFLSDLFGTDVVVKVIEGVYKPSIRGELTEHNSIYFLFERDNMIEVVKPIGKR